MSTYNHKIEVTNGNTTDTYHPETNSGQVYDFTNEKWLNQTIGALNALSTTQKSSIIEAINEIANRPIGEGIDTAQLTNLITTSVNQVTTTLNSKVLNIGIKVLDKVSILEYEHLKVATSQGEDWQPVFQHIVNIFGGNVHIVVPYRTEPYKLSRKVLVPENQSFILSGDVVYTTIQAHNNFTDDYLFELQGGFFKLNNVTLYGHSKDGLTLFGGKKGNYGSYRIEQVRLYNAEHGIKFDGASEFPLGGQFDDIFAMNMYTSAIKMATDSAPTSGQSCHEYNNVRLNNSQIRDRVGHLASNISVTEGATSDIITWSNTNMKEYGWVVMRKPKGVTNPSATNWVNVGQSSDTSITVNKANGTQWDYTVLRRTVGMKIKHLKAVTFGTLQSEYFTTGVIVESCTGVTINTFYNEWRGFSATNTPNTTGDGILVFSTNGFTLLGGWQEFGRSVVRISYSSGTFVTGVRGGNLSSSIIYYEGHTFDAQHRVGTNIPIGSTSSVVGDDGSVYSKNYIADNPKHGASKTGATDGIENVISHGLKARQAVQYRGGEKEGSLEVDSVGSTLKVNKLLVSNNNKNIEPPLQTNQLTNIPTRNVATPILNIAVANNAMGLYMFNYSVEIVNNYVSRHVEGGTLKIAVLRSSAEAIKYNVSIEDRVSLTQSYATTASAVLDSTTGNLIVNLTVDNNWMDNGGSARLRLVPISGLKNNDNIVVTQL